MNHACLVAREYARSTTRDPWLIAVWVMEFNSMSTYTGRQAMRAWLVREVIQERAANAHV